MKELVKFIDKAILLFNSESISRKIEITHVFMFSEL